MAPDRGGGVGFGHGVPEGRLKARLQRHGATLRRTATARQTACTGHQRWLALRFAVRCPTDGGLARRRWPLLEAPVQFTDDHADITDEPQERCRNSPWCSGSLGAP